MAGFASFLIPIRYSTTIFRLCLIFLLSLVYSVAVSAETVTVSGARIGGDSEQTRFVLDIDRKVPVEISQNGDFTQVKIFLPPATFDLPPGAGAITRGLVKGFRYGASSDGRTQVVIDLTTAARLSATEFIDNKGRRPARLVLDLKPGGTPDPGRELRAEVAQPTVLPRQPQAQKVIVLDPGHGGIDPGASSRNKTREKDVVFAFAKTLEKQPLASGHFKVVLTRNSDIFLTLPDRVKIAREAKADMFIALHADINRGKTTRGLTFYTLSEKASDAEAEAFANKENRADDIAGLELPPETNAVADILFDLVQRESKSQAGLFAIGAVAELSKVTELTGQPVRSAGFVVLKAPDVPSVLVELGYLSSGADEKLLLDENWRSKTAAAMTRAINTYFDQAAVLTTGSTGDVAPPSP